MGLIDTSKMRQGTYVEIDGDPNLILQYQHVKPGKGNAFVRMRVKSLTTGRVLDKTIKSGDVLPEAEVAQREMQYLYTNGDQLVFMDQENFEQIEIRAELVEGRDLMPEECKVDVLLHNDKPIGVELPNFVVLEVAETDPVERGGGGKLKPAKMSSGAMIPVPSFIARGEKIRVDTRERCYMDRA